jgi:hypothetical protein
MYLIAGYIMVIRSIVCEVLFILGKYFVEEQMEKVGRQRRKVCSVASTRTKTNYFINRKKEKRIEKAP